MNWFIRVCVFVCVCVLNTCRQTERHTDRQTDNTMHQSTSETGRRRWLWPASTADHSPPVRRRHSHTPWHRNANHHHHHHHYQQHWNTSYETHSWLSTVVLNNWPRGHHYTPNPHSACPLSSLRNHSASSRMPASTVAWLTGDSTNDIDSSRNE